MVKINNIITGSNDITLTNLNVKPYGFNKTYMDKDLIEDKLYQMINQINQMKKITTVKFYLILLNEIHPFYDENGRTRKILFANNDKIN